MHPCLTRFFFTPLGHAIHGTEHIDKLGNRASHGCVRLDPINAATLFALVQEVGMPNTTVIITGKAVTKPATTAVRKAKKINGTAVITASSRPAPLALVEEIDDDMANKKRQPWPYERPN